MRLAEGLASKVDVSPLKRRFLAGVVAFCLVAWDFHAFHRSINENDVVLLSALGLSFFVTWGGKKFWFLWGIAAGVLLLGIVRLALLFVK